MEIKWRDRREKASFGLDTFEMLVLLFWVYSKVVYHSCQSGLYLVNSRELVHSLAFGQFVSWRLLLPFCPHCLIPPAHFHYTSLFGDRPIAACVKGEITDLCSSNHWQIGRNKSQCRNYWKNKAKHVNCHIYMDASKPKGNTNVQFKSDFSQCLLCLTHCDNCYWSKLHCGTLLNCASC